MRDLALIPAYFKIAARVLRAHALRSLLTVVSITIGAFSIVFMTSLADSGLTTIMRDVEDVGGARLLIIAPDEPEKMKGKRALAPGYFTRADQQALTDSLPHLAERTWYAELEEQEVLSDAGRSVSADGVAADTGFLGAFGFKIGKGRSFTDDENRTRQQVCVVGHQTAQDLFDGDAVGQRISVFGMRCLIVGQTAKLSRVGMSFGFSWDELVIMPLETLRDVSPQAAMGTFLVAKTDAAAHNDIVKRIANAVMQHRHHGVDDYEIWDFAGVMEQFAMIFRILKLIVGLVASISLLVGGVGVMNMMFVSVSERTKEIGIRKALGASPHAIQAQFLFEAMLLSSIGGFLGVSLGVAVALAANLGIKLLEEAWVGVVSVPAVVIAAVVSLAVGVGFGFVPAKRAAMLDAVEAMRR